MTAKAKAAPKATKNAKALKANPAKAAEPQAPPTPAAKPVAEKDALGCRKTSQSATINSQLSTKTAKTAAAIAEATGINAGRVRAHLLYLCKKELAKQTDAGCILVAKK